MKQVIIWPEAQPTICNVIETFTDREGTFHIVQLPDGAKLCVADKYVKHLVN